MELCKFYLFLPIYTILLVNIAAGLGEIPIMYENIATFAEWYLSDYVIIFRSIKLFDKLNNVRTYQISI